MLAGKQYFLPPSSLFFNLFPVIKKNPLLLMKGWYSRGWKWPKPVGVSTKSLDLDSSELEELYFMKNDTEFLNSGKKPPHTYRPKTRFSYLMPTYNCKVKWRRKNYSKWKKNESTIKRSIWVARESESRGENTVRNEMEEEESKGEIQTEWSKE